LWGYSKQWIWPDVSLRRNAQAAIDEAFFVALAVAAYRLVWVLILYLRETDKGPEAGALLIAIFIAILAVGIHYRSRVAAIVAFTFYVLDFLFVSVVVRPQNPNIPAAIALALLAGVRGTIAYRKFPPKPANLPGIADSLGQ
jgi:hypothetical protein